MSRRTSARHTVIALDEFGAPRAWATAPTLDAAVERCTNEARLYLDDPTREAGELRLVTPTLGAEHVARDLGVSVRRAGATAVCRYCREPRPSGYSVTCGASACQERAYRDAKHPRREVRTSGGAR